jgi:hypothetical protein
LTRTNVNNESDPVESALVSMGGLDNALINWSPRRRIVHRLARAAYPGKSLAFAAFG